MQLLSKFQLHFFTEMQKSPKILTDNFNTCVICKSGSDIALPLQIVLFLALASFVILLLLKARHLV